MIPRSGFAQPKTHRFYNAPQDEEPEEHPPSAGAHGHLQRIPLREVGVRARGVGHQRRCRGRVRHAEAPLRQLEGFYGDLRWVYPNPRHMLLLKEQSLIPKRLSIYIPRVVCELKLTVDLNHCDQLSELSTTITTLPAHFDRMGVSLEIIDKPSTKVFSDSNDATTIEKFANDLKVIRKNLVFKQLDYRGSDHLSD